MTKLQVLVVMLCTMLASCTTFRTPHDVSFQDAPCIIPIKGFLFKTCSDMHVYVDNSLIVVPAGYKTDLASIPRVFWNILPPQQANFIAPAILHDYLYATGYASRKYDDDVLYSALRSQGTMWITANVMWLGVRCGGSKHYATSEIHSE